MYASSKPKSLATQRAQAIANSRHQFVAALNASFDTAENFLRNSGSAAGNRSLKQTKLQFGNLNKRQKYENLAKPEVFLMPLPQPKLAPRPQQQQLQRLTENLNKTIDVVQQRVDVVHTAEEAAQVRSAEHANEKMPSTSSSTIINPLRLKGGRTKVAMLGRVDFCLKMHKLHTTMDALWDVYGQLKRITKGKQRGENILLMRNADGGPVLQCVYYDFALSGLEIGCFLRTIGRFVGDNRLQTFKVQKIEEENYLQWSEHFVRIQNVSSFALLQNDE